MLESLPVEILASILLMLNDNDETAFQTALRIEAVSKHMRAAMVHFWSKFLLRVDFVRITIEKDKESFNNALQSSKNYERKVQLALLIRGYNNVLQENIKLSIAVILQ
jgi:hypothetical protein